MKNSLFFLSIFLLFSVVPSLAGEADVINVQVTTSKNETFTFDVTISHSDSGWDHYVNKWEILDEKDELLGTRVLYHPHVDEQPFTRSLSGVKIPENIKKVKVRAHDSVHGYGGKEISVNLP